MHPSAPRLWLDVVDPLSYLVELELQALEDEGLEPMVRSPLELRAPPAPLLDPDGEAWSDRRRRASTLAEAAGVPLAPQSFVPWSRKAWELVLHAREVDREREVRTAVFHAFHRDGLDVGRVDVLVELATSLGLDHTRAKAVLDVDRHSAAVAASGGEAQALGATTPPALWTGSQLVRGFHNRDGLRTLLNP